MVTDLQRTHPRQLRPACVTHNHELGLSPSPTRLTTPTSVPSKARCGRDTLYNNRICKMSLRPGVFKLQQLASSQLAECLPDTTGSTREILRLDRGLNWAPMR